jgi:hypothetical protein
MASTESAAPRRARRPFLQLLADQRGTASVEAAMVLPLMALCWAGLFFRLSTLDATLQSGVEARRAAWISSNNACVGDDSEPVCTSSSAVDTGSFLDGLADVPSVGFLFGSLLGSSTVARVVREVNRPVVFGGGTTQVGYGYYIMCNEEPMDLNDLLRATICEQLGDSLGFVMSCPGDRHTDVPPDCSLDPSD